MRGGAKGQMKRLVIPWPVAGLGLGVRGVIARRGLPERVGRGDGSVLGKPPLGTPAATPNIEGKRLIEGGAVDPCLSAGDDLFDYRFHAWPRTAAVPWAPCDTSDLYASPPTPRPLSLDGVGDGSVRIEAGGDELAVEAAATVDTRRPVGQLNARMATIEATDDPLETGIGAVDLGETVAPPPQGVALGR